MFLPLSIQAIIPPDDLIVTINADTFVMKHDIFDEPVSQENAGKISILQVENLLEILNTFQIPFHIIISVWRPTAIRQLLRLGFHFNAALPLAVIAQSGKKVGKKVR